MLLEQEGASLQTRVTRLVAARDPGHARLVNASAVTLGVLASVMLGSVIVHAFHASPGMLSLSLFLSVQAGNLAKGQSAKDRLLTTALMIPAAAAAILLAVAADQIRPLAIVGFVAVTGLAVWVRRYGQRASALGGIGFISYFFTLFMRPEGERIFTFLLIVMCAIVPQLVVRWVLLRRRPRREIQVLLHELRAASLVVIAAASKATQLPQIRMPLARADAIGLAITEWQDQYQTEHYVACSSREFAARVLDARVDTEEVAGELVRERARGELGEEIKAGMSQLAAVLARGAAEHDLAASVHWASAVVAPGTAHADSHPPAVYLIARAVLTHARLRSIDLSHGVAPVAQRHTHLGAHGEHSSQPPQHAPEQHAEHRAARSHSAPHAGAERSANRTGRPHFSWKPWREWSSVSRMTVQAMIAASIASAVGEAISASRWYWAVMTAFVIFIGASTRSGILTRAVRRIWGTLGGILLGALAVMISGDSTWIVVLLAVCAVFGMLYFGPVNYVYSALFITTMLVAIYHLLGVLNVQLLELRLVETLTGAAIGVLSAYFILSASSRPALDAQVKSYLDGVQQVLQAALEALASPRRANAVVAALHTLEAREATVDRTVASMSAAFAFESGKRQTETVHLMYVVTRAAARLTQTVEELTVDVREDAELRIVRDAVSQSVSLVEQTVEHTKTVLLGTGASDGVPDPAAVLTELQSDALRAGSAGAAAVQALARMNWAMHRVRRDDIAARQRGSGR